MITGILMCGLGIGAILMGLNGMERKEQEQKRHQPPAEAVSQTSFAPHSTYQFIWYGCPHCLKFEQALLDRAKRSPSINLDDEIQVVPMTGRRTWDLHARLFFLLDDAGFKSADHLEVMKLIQANSANDVESITKIVGPFVVEWAKAHPGNTLVNLDALGLKLSSPKINQMMSDAALLAADLTIPGVPTVYTFDGQLIEPSPLAGYDAMANQVFEHLEH